MPKFSDPYLDPRPYRGVYHIKWSEWTGQRWTSRRLSTRQKTRPEAQAVFAGWLSAGGPAGQAPIEEVDADSMALGQLLDEYLAKRCRPRGQEKSQGYNLAVIRRELGALPLAAVTSRRLEEHMAARAGAGVSGATIRRQVNTLLAAYSFCERKKIIPAGLRPNVELPEDSKPRERWLTRAQEAAHLAAAAAEPNPKVYLITLLGLHTAHRAGALCDLTWERVNFETGLIDFRDPRLPQTRKRRTVVPMTAELRRALMEWRVRQGPGQKLVLGYGAKKAYMRWLPRSPHPWATLHVLRHTFATLALQAGRPIWQVAGVLADDVQTVQRTYGHHCPDHLNDTINFR